MSTDDLLALQRACQEKYQQFTQAAKDLEAAFRAHAKPNAYTKDAYHECTLTYLATHQALLGQIATYQAALTRPSHAKKMQTAVANIHKTTLNELLPLEQMDLFATELKEKLQKEREKFLGHIKKINELIASKREAIAQIHYDFYLSSIENQKNIMNQILLFAKYLQNETATSLLNQVSSCLTDIEEAKKQLSRDVIPHLPKFKT